MRIISGAYKGRRLSAPTNITTRPTTDFAKEGLFNLLNNKIDFEGIEVLDLFAGIGGISYEFVSRGCKSVVAVETGQIQINFIRKVCAELKIDNLFINKMDVFKFVKNCHKQFDIVFADPPYEHKDFETIPDMIFANDILKTSGLFILEHSSKFSFENHPNFDEHRHYGNVNFSFFRSNY